MKKICMIIPSFTAKGGITSVVNGYRGSRLEKEYQVHYIETYSDVNKIKKFFKALEAYCKFLYQVIVWKPDLVHIHSSFGASFFRKLPFIYMSSFFHIPIINHIHGSAIDDLYTYAGKIKKRIVVDNFKRCDKVIVLSQEWKDRYRKIIDVDKLFVIENYSVLKEKEYKDASETKQVLFLGFLSEAKGCFDLVEVARQILMCTSNVRFVLAGAGTPSDEKKLKSAVEGMKIDKYVFFPGWVRGKDKDDLLKKSDIFILPSYNEAMPMSILEAMGYGLPIISTNVGGIPQVVYDNINGFKIEPGNVEGFVKALKKLLTDQTLLVEMGKKSKDIIEKKYSIDMHLDKLIKLYETTINGRSSLC